MATSLSELAQNVANLIATVNLRKAVLDGAVNTAAGIRDSILESLATSPTAAALAANLLLPNGTERVKYRNRLLAAKLTDRPSVLDEGGAPDGVSDCADAVVALYTRYGSGVRIHFPMVPGTANVYSFRAGTDWLAAFGDCVPDVDEGVTLKVQEYGAFYTGQANNMKFARSTRLLIADVGGPAKIFGANARKKPVDKALWLHANTLDRAVIKTVDTSKLKKVAAPWNDPDGDRPATAIIPSAYIAAADANSSVAFSAMANDGYFHCAESRCAPGDERTFYLSDVVAPAEVDGSGNPAPTSIFGPMVRFLSGYIMIGAKNAIGDAAAVNIYTRIGSAAGTSQDLAYLGRGSHGSYAPIRSYITIRILGYKRFAVLLNGMVISELTTPTEIVGCGPAAFANSIGVGVKAKALTVQRGGTMAAGRVLNIGVFGDSRSATRHDDKVQSFAEALEGTCGIRVASIENRAVAGDSTRRQLERLQEQGAPVGLHLAVIDLLTNDGQGQADVATSLNDLTQIIALILAANPTCKIHLTGFALWWDRPQSGGFGQDSQNYDKCGSYRQELARYAAFHGYSYLDANPVIGPVYSGFGGYGAAGVPSYPGVETPMEDGIHYAAHTARKLGYAEAGKAAALFVDAPTKALEWQLFDESAYGAGYALRLGEELRYCIDADGWCTAQGVIKIDGGTLANDNGVLNIPEHLWPDTQGRERFSVMLYNGGAVRLEMDATGVVRSYDRTVAGDQYLLVEGMRWKIAQG